MPMRSHFPRWAMIFYYPPQVTEEMGPTGIIPGAHHTTIDRTDRSQDWLEDLLESFLDTEETKAAHAANRAALVESIGAAAELARSTAEEEQPAEAEDLGGNSRPERIYDQREKSVKQGGEGDHQLFVADQVRKTSLTTANPVFRKAGSGSDKPRGGSDARARGGCGGRRPGCSAPARSGAAGVFRRWGRGGRGLWPRQVEGPLPARDRGGPRLQCACLPFVHTHTHTHTDPDRA